MNKNILKIAKNLDSKFYFDYNIGNLTWFRTGGNAKVFIIVENSNELEIILNEIENKKFYILGSGSNLLVRDKGFDGVVIKLGKGFNFCNLIENHLDVGASVLDINLSNFALKNSIKDYEFFSGIPGSVGGAIKMNAGCFGSETKDNIESIKVFCPNLNKIIKLKEELKFSYRNSNIKNNQVILSASFKMKYSDVNSIKEKMKYIKKQRLSSQPIVNRTSGSTFKNPPNQYAAKLIEDSGCKGMSYGNAFVSEKHANFFINNGKASAHDLETLGKLVIEEVYNKFAIKLDWEVKIIGEH